MRRLIIAFLLICCSSGCTSASKPLVWKSKKFTADSYTIYEIQQVSNATGTFIKREVLSFLTESLKDQFTSKNLQLLDSQQSINEVLIVRSEILKYKFQFFTGPPPPSGDTTGLCILRTRLFQKSSDEIVAEIVTVKKVDVGQGILEPDDYEDILRESAAAVALEVAKMM